MKWLRKNADWLMSICLMVMVIGVFGPLELFSTNASEFWFGFDEVLKISTLMAVVCGGILIGVGLLLKGNVRRYYGVVIFAVAIALYIQGNYANINYGALDGDAINWGAYTGYAIVDTLGWLLLLGGAIILALKKPSIMQKIQLYGSAFVMAMLVLSLGVIYLTGDVLTEEKSDYYLSSEGMYEVSSDENIIVFVLDAFDDAYFQAVYEEDPEKYDQIFKDFTYFDNASVAAARTVAAMPAIITGEAYPGEVSFAQYIENAFNSDGLYSTMKTQNYDVRIYTNPVNVPDNVESLIDNQVSSGYKVGSYKGLADSYCKLTLYKYVPHILKPIFWIYSGEFDAYKIGSSASAYVTDDAEFLKNMDLKLNEQNNVFRLFHLNGPHSPYTLDEQGKRQDNSDLRRQTKGVLYIIEEYISQLTSLGVYDETTIIILADHGESNESNENDNSAHGILFAKRRRDQGDFQIKSTPVSYFDLHATLLSELGIEDKETFFDIQNNIDRTRYFYQFVTSDGKYKVEEYEVRGDLDDENSVTLTGRTLAPYTELKKYQFGELLTFGSDSNALSYIESGIAASGDYAWSNGYSSEFVIPLKRAPKNDVKISFTVINVYNKMGPQRVRAYVNDRFCYETTMNSAGILSFYVPKDYLAKDLTLCLRLEYPDAICPAQVFGQGFDERTLALAINKMVIEDSGIAEYEANAQLSFEKGNLPQYIQKGFSYSNNDTYAWTNAKNAELAFDLGATPVSDLSVSLDVMAVYAANGPQRVKISANGVCCYEDILDTGKKVEFTVPKSAIIDGYLLLELELPDAISPYELTGEGDVRTLALALQGMAINYEPAAKNGILSNITGIIATPLTVLMNLCYRLVDNYIAAIVIFTLLSKIILLPISLWMQRNSIKMVELMPDLNRLKIKYFGDKETISEETQVLYKQKGYQPLLSTLPMIIQIVMLMGVIEAVKALLGTSGSWLLLIPSEVGGVTLLMPLAAGFAAFLLCVAQNKIAPLQKEQHKAEKLSTGLVSVSISLFLGAYVSLGTGVYWIASNLISIPMQMVCNLIVNPKKYVDYEALEASRKQLAELEGIGKKKKESYFSDNKRRERADYKRFFSVVNKHLVFYSESNGFYKYFKGFIEFILEHSNLIIHYITSDPNDQIFELEKQNPRIRAYYIGENKLITLMMKLEADVVVMTMPDLENYHIKRSYIRKDIEYIYVQHGMGSNNMCLRTGCVDHFDTVFCAGIHQKEEVEQTEQVYGLPKKTCVELGYPMIDEMRSAYAASEHKENKRKKILIAPSWQKDNIIDSCLEELLDALKNTDHEIIVRPHPQEVRMKSEYMSALKQKYEPAGIEIQTDFSSNNPIMEADILITDWSGISWEYAFTTLRPILYINTPMRVMNPEYQKIKTIPLNILLRDKLGKSLDLDQLDKTAETVDYLLSRSEEYRDEIDKLAHQYLYNLGHSSEVGAKYIIRRIQKKAAERSRK